MNRRQWLTAAALGAPLVRHACATAAPAAAAATAEPLGAPAPVAQLHLDRLGNLLAVTRGGELLQAGATRWQTLGAGLDPSAPIASGHGRIVGRSSAGGLWVLEAGRVQRADRPMLAPHAGLLVLPFGIIALAVEAGAVARVIRLDPDGTSWVEVARHTEAALPDARPLQFDFSSAASGPAADENGHVVVFAAPSDRYPHGVLGDAVEPTALLLLERHGLTPMARIDLPPPYVFEDIAPRPIAWRGQRALLTVRSGPLGAQLCVVAPGADSARLEIAALGEPIGAANRWLSPSTDGQRILAVVTPHIGGVLHRYGQQGERLPGAAIARGLTNHTIGQRELDVSAWIGRRWVVAAQDRQRLRVMAVDAAPQGATPTDIALAAPVVALKAWRRGPDGGVAALLQDGTVWWVRIA